ncbi:MAG: hypothetical protein LBR80_12140 [Deltaproteobacteria bacterium]|nr:hypothetical protein [Deltaproteobacteria bacterium]
MSILKERNDAIDALGASLDKLAAKIDLNRLATREDFERLAAREDFERLATREDFGRLATREGLKNLGMLLEAANNYFDVRFAAQTQALADTKELLRTEIRNNEKSIDLLGWRLDDLFASLNRR